MSLAKRIITEARLNLGDQPDFIDPEKRRKLEQGGHPYGEGFPSDTVASEAYADMMRKIQRYTGIRPSGRNDLGGLTGQMMQAVMQAHQIEMRHRTELQQLAVDLVLELPEFKGAREAVDNGDLKIVAVLTSNVTISRKHLMPASDDPARADLRVSEIAKELNLEVEKRRLINMMVQGNAMAKNYAYHLASDKLNEIDPRLLNLYGAAMSVAELNYWSNSEEAWQHIMAHGSAGGSVHLTSSNGVPTIRAEAVVFPVLVQEITKGLMEYLSHDEDIDSDTRNYAHGKADTLNAEQWDIMVGPGAWRKFLAAVGEDNHDLIPAIYDSLVHLPAGEFKRVMHGVLNGSADGQDYIQSLVLELRDEAQS